MKRCRLLLPVLLPVLVPVLLGATRVQSFDSDPGWAGENNRVAVREYPTVTQDFGYSRTNHAGAAPGEMGGLVTRAATPAYYGDKIGPVTLDQKLAAAGTFAFTQTNPGAGVFVGFFQADQPGASGRPIGSLGMDFDTEGGGARLAVRLITARNQSCGTFVTPYVSGKFRPTPLRNDGTRYRWTFDYDPDAAGGRGRFTYTIQGEEPKPGSLVDADAPEVHKAEARIRFPDTTSFSVDLPAGFKQQGTTFTHFGMMNMMKPGGRLAIHLDDLHYLGRAQDFSKDPHWDASGNRTTYTARDVDGAHDFGFSETHHAGGAKPGEIGGTFWRTDKWGYYATRVEPLTFDDRLEARGKVAMVVGGVDADMCFGWFRVPGGDGRGEAGGGGGGGGEGEDRAPNRTGEFLGIKVGGPTRIGHMFLPTFTVNEKLRGLPDHGPVMRPGKACDWSLVYDPQANDGHGAITATLDGESVTHNLKPGQKAKAKDARLDRFGMFSIGPGGQIVKIYLDDVTYTERR